MKVTIAIATTILVSAQALADKPTVKLDKNFGKNSPQTLKGKVLELWKAPASHDNNGNFSFLVVSSENSKVYLQLGPTWSLNEYEKSFQKGVAVNAIGFRIEFQGKPIFVPKEVSTDNKKFLFPIPSEIGFPSWKFP